MENMSLSLEQHWEVFIKNEIASGRYGSASEVVRDALRTLEESKKNITALYSHIGEGVKQAECGNFIDQSLDSMLGEFRVKLDQSLDTMLDEFKV